MSRKLFLIVALSLAFFKDANSFVCLPDHCASVQCERVEKCDGPNQVVEPGGLCNCCNVCYTIRGENEPCSVSSTVLLGVPPPRSRCDQGLICYEGKCQSFKALTRSSGLVVDKV